MPRGSFGLVRRAGSYLAVIMPLMALAAIWVAARPSEHVAGAMVRLERPSFALDGERLTVDRSGRREASRALTSAVERVAREAPLATDPLWRRELGEGGIAALLAWLSDAFLDDVPGGLPPTSKTDEEVRLRLHRMVDIEPAGADLWLVRATATSTALATSVAGSVASVLIRARDEAIGNERRVRRERLERARRAISDAEQAAEELRAIAPRPAAGGRAEFDAAAAERARLEARIAAIDRFRAGADAAPDLPPSLSDLARRRADLTVRRAEIEKKYLARHPAAIKAAEEARKLDREIAVRAGSERAAAVAELSKARQREDDARSAFEAAEREAAEVAAAQKSLAAKEREIAALVHEREEASADIMEAASWRTAAQGGAAIVSDPISRLGDRETRRIPWGIAVAILLAALAVLLARPIRLLRTPTIGAPPRTGGRVALGLGTAALGIGIAGWGVVSTAAALASLPGDEILAKMRRGEVLDAADPTTLAASRKAALAFLDAARMHTDLGLAFVLEAVRAKDPAQRRELAENARRELRRGLAEAPARPHAWTRLAAVEIELQGATPAAAAAIARAIVTGPHERDLAIPRLDIALAVRDVLPPSTDELLDAQLRFALAIDADRARRVAAAHDAEGILAAAAQRR